MKNYIAKNSKVLITGGAGFIGSCLARKLLERSYNNIFVFDNFSTGIRESVPSGCMVIEGDIRKKEDFKELPKDIEYVYHLAAATSVEESFAKPEYYLQNNVYGTMNVLSWSVENKIKKIIYASSAAVYGDIGKLGIMQEDSVPNPINYYALTKLDGEYLVRMHNLNFGLDFSILRYFNIFGEGQDYKSCYASVIPKFIYYAISGKDLTIYGTGRQTRDFIHVDEACEATILAMEKGDQTYNVASREQYDINTVAKLILKYIKTNSRIVYLPPLPGDSMYDNGCNKRLIELGWSRKYPFEHWLQKTIEWYQEHINTHEALRSSNA